MRALPFLVLAALATRFVTLKWTPTVGDKAVYKLTMAVGPYAKFDGTLDEEVVSVDATDAVTKSTGTLLAKGSNGEVTESPVTEDSTTISLGGTVLRVEEADQGPKGDSFRLARLGALMLPGSSVAIGGHWTSTAHEDDRPDVPDLKIDYTLVGEEKIGTWDAYKIDAKGGEVGKGLAKVEATFWVDKTTGARIQTHIRIVRPGEKGSEPTTIVSDVVRQS